MILLVLLAYVSVISFFTFYKVSQINQDNAAVDPGLPGWNEIAPYMMQLGSLGFLAMMFLARIFLLRP